MKRFDIELVGSSRIYQLKSQLAGEKDRRTVEKMSGIYKIACSDCPKVYIGQTKRLATTRFKEHMKEAELAVRYSRKPTKSMVAKHMVECDHKVSAEDLKVLKQVRKINQLDAYESWFISKQIIAQ